jgi:hypothetical protein
MDPIGWLRQRGPIEWLREQDRAFQAVVVGGSSLVGVVALVVGIAVAVTIAGMDVADGGESRTEPLDAEFAVDETDHGVTFTFERGETLRAGDVYVELDHSHEGHVHREAWADRSGLAHDESIPPGSAVTVNGARSGDVLRVVYRPGNEGRVLVDSTV